MPGANVGMINIGEMIGKSMGIKERKEAGECERPEVMGQTGPGAAKTNEN